ncbi:hypothetical protein GCM10022242_38510 [Nocardioides panacisoli]|uniref:Response regulatory domain-containing protein n=1 Tax=Nocardioides panacisoli TaxID=627624 RepID=A0ABP7J4U4_9ACTN
MLLPPLAVPGGTNENYAVEVLIVDDQPPFRAVAGQLVSLIGWHLAGEAESGELAVEAARTLHPGLVLMDINLPGISGIEATRKITDEMPDVRVVLLSTYAEDDLPADARDCGALAYVHKEDLTPRVLRDLIA